GGPLRAGCDESLLDGGRRRRDLRGEGSAARSAARARFCGGRGRPRNLGRRVAGERSRTDRAGWVALDGDGLVSKLVGTRAEWLAARTALLAEEKELTRRSYELARKRQELPWVAVEEAYSFEADDGTKTLAGLFDGRSQLLVYHFMFGPTVEGWPEAGCPGCSY